MLGTYNGCVIHEDSRVANGITTGGLVAPTVRRAVFCGAQSANIAFGNQDDFGKYNWVEELFDYENQVGCSAGVIYGLKKAVYNNQDYGTIVMSSYAMSH